MSVTKPIILKKINVLSDKKNNIMKSPYLEVVISETKGEFLKCQYDKVKILNTLDVRNQCSRTIAKCFTGDKIVERSSDGVVKLIGQKNYDMLFSALCSVINQESRIRGIFATLTENKDSQVEASTQTEDSDKPVFVKPKRKRNKRNITPYVVRDEIKSESTITKVVINPDDFQKWQSSTQEQIKVESMPDTCNDNSNDSVGMMSNYSVNTNATLLNDLTFSLIDKVDKCTMEGELNELKEDHMNQKESQPNKSLFDLTLPDGSVIKLPLKPEDDLHLATEENIKYLNDKDRKKLMQYQVRIDFETCLLKDEEGNSPIHTAVLNKDIKLLNRQCIMLSLRNQSVDICNGDWTPLKMALSKDSALITRTLLNFGADPLQCDSDHRTPIHIAAESKSEHLQVILDYCAKNAGKLLQENDLWKPNFESLENDELTKMLLMHISTICDKQGYTPLMLASKIGLYENVKLLALPETVDKQMPTSGSTALYLTISAACVDAIERGNKNKVTDRFMTTVDILIEKEADASVKNFNGFCVTDLLNEFNVPELSMKISHKMTTKLLHSGLSKDFDAYMLVKSADGSVNVEQISYGHLKRNKSKPVIVENILIGKNSSQAEDDDKNVTTDTNNTDKINILSCKKIAIMKRVTSNNNMKVALDYSIKENSSDDNVVVKTSDINSREISVTHAKAGNSCANIKIESSNVNVKTLVNPLKVENLDANFGAGTSTADVKTTTLDTTVKVETPIAIKVAPSQIIKNVANTINMFHKVVKPTSKVKIINLAEPVKRKIVTTPKQNVKIIKLE